MTLSNFSMLIHEFLKKDPDKVPVTAPLSVCWSGLHGPIVYSLLGGGVPIPEHRLCGTLEFVHLRF